VPAGQRFPERLVEALAGSPTTLHLVANLGVDGYTSADLIRDELPELERLAPDLVTVLIGVNDVVRRVPLGTYEDNAATILDALLARLPPRRIAVVGIPDYTVTPAGADHGDPAVQGAAIRAANMVMARLAAERSIEFIDIFDISREAATDRSLVAEDGLHPSGAQYAHWVERLAPVVRRLLAS
jgi:lysophospholipase L1-like esterase